MTKLTTWVIGAEGAKPSAVVEIDTTCGASVIVVYADGLALGWTIEDGTKRYIRTGDRFSLDYWLATEDPAEALRRIFRENDNLWRGPVEQWWNGQRQIKARQLSSVD